MDFFSSALIELDIAETMQTYGPRDCALYALGVGAGMDPLDPQQLAFADPDRIVALPSMAVVLGYDGFWIDQLPTGIDVTQVLHGEQRLTLERPLASSGAIRRKTRVTGVIDKGPGRGALVLTEDRITDAVSGALIATLRSSILCRAEGGRGGTLDSAPSPHPVPDRVPDGQLVLPASPQQALIYRLSGDLNPLHSDPETAKAAGFPAPILHGLASYGMACQGMVRALCGGDSGRLRTLDVRFTRPVYPGETLVLHWWREGEGRAAFRLIARNPAVTVIDNGRCEFTN